MKEKMIKILQLIIILSLLPVMAIASSNRLTLEDANGSVTGLPTNAFYVYDLNNSGGLYGVINNGSNYSVPVYTGTNSISPSSILTDNGTNLGIGTTSPLYKLDVNGPLRTTGIVVGTASGLNNSASFWMCTNPSCSTTCQVTISGGAITSCV